MTDMLMLLRLFKTMNVQKKKKFKNGGLLEAIENWIPLKRTGFAWN